MYIQIQNYFKTNKKMEKLNINLATELLEKLHQKGFLNTEKDLTIFDEELECEKYTDKNQDVFDLICDILRGA